MEKNICPICKRSCKNIPFSNRDAVTVECPTCGIYYITRSAFLSLGNLSVFQQRALAHWLYKKSLGYKNPVFLTSDILGKILPELKLPSADEQFNNLIQFLGTSAITPEAIITIPPDAVSAIFGTNGMEGANYVMNHLKDKGIIYISERTTIVRLQLTPDGWERFGKLRTAEHDGTLVFMAMEYGNAMTDSAYKEFFKKAVADTGFDLKILDEGLKAGLIDDQLRVRIRQSKFILCDLSSDNHGAYWEAGYAEGLGKHVIYLCEKSKWKDYQTHFDTNHQTTVMWSPDTIAEDMKRLKATIRATFPSEAKMQDETVTQGSVS